MFRREPTFALILAALFASQLFAANPWLAEQNGQSILRADLPPCTEGGNADNKAFTVRDCVSASSCASGGEFTVRWLCDSGTYRAINYVAGAGISAATTSAAGISELANNGENAANVVVQGNDTRINAPRTIRVYAGATDVTGKTYDTIKEAVDYVGTQSAGATTQWQVVVLGGGSFTESPFTIPSYTEVVCAHGSRGRDYYFNQTLITATVLGGDFVTMETHARLRNCSVYAAGNSTSPRTVIACNATGSYACHLNGVSVYSDELGASTEANIGISAVAGGAGVLSLDQVDIVSRGGNSNMVGIKIGAANDLQYNDGVISNTIGGSAKGIQSLADSPRTVWLKNVQVGNPSGGTEFTTDLSEEGTGSFYVQGTVYKSSSGTITSNDPGHDWTGTAPPVACSASTITTKYWDTDIGKVCQCNGTNYVLTTDFSTTTGCS